MPQVPAPIIMPYKGIWPRIHETAFIAPGAAVIGDVEIGAESSVWFGCVLRGDVNVIRVGRGTNIQDACVVHVTAGGQGTHIGNHITIGHSAVLHDCTLHDYSFVGMQAMVMDLAVIESHAMLAAGAVLTGGKKILTNQLWAGNPAKYWRDLKPEEHAMIDDRGPHYARLAADYR